ncbi:sigma-54-dependent transcriptional regulator [Necropsobacter rosorum]|uniref:sigma-54-dependent transcriptional regulator n=1 Tax=Necropsobacter rosorum TaxID=908285 RepID=UPI000509F892
MQIEDCNVLLIDDDIDILESYQDLLSQEGYRVLAIADPKRFLPSLPACWPGVVLCDVLLPDISGLQVLEQIMHTDSQIPVMMITGHGDIPMAVEAVKKGALDFLEKPLSPERLLVQVKRALDTRIRIIERRQWQLDKLNEKFIGNTEYIQSLRHQLQKLACSNIPVFLWGQIGTGRHLAATYLHKLSEYKKSPFVYYECLPDTSTDIENLLLQAKQTSLILKNIHYLSDAEQQYLANKLNSDAKSVRLIIISDLSLLSLISQQSLNPELYYLLIHTQVELQALKKHPADIPAIFNHYVRSNCAKLNKEYIEPSKKLLRHLMTLAWPGNVKELINVAALYSIGLFSQQSIHTGLPATIIKPETVNPLHDQIEEYEKQIIEDALIFYQGRINDVAAYLDIPRKKLYLRMRKYGIDKKDYKF